MTTPINLEDHVDDAHLSVLRAIPADLVDLSDITAARANIDGRRAAVEDPPLPEGVTIETVMVPGLDGDPDVPVKLYRPGQQTQNAPGLFWIHGGGMVLGSAAMHDPECAHRAAMLGAVVASVEYRLAPEHPFPAPMNDCYAGLSWFAASAGDLGIDSDRIAIGGPSAGGGLAAGLALMARDKGGPAICFQLLIYPMIDHRNETPSSHRITDTRVWNREANLIGWASYLGEAEDVSIYASPSTAADLSGLPPTYINVGTLDLFLDEDIAYAQALTAADVPVELHVYPGAFHGSNGTVSRAALSKRWRADEDAALRRALLD